MASHNSFHSLNHDSDHPFAHTRMPLGDHIEELRARLIKAGLGFGIILVAVFTLDLLGYSLQSPIGIAWPVTQFLSWPVKKELERFQERRLDKALTMLTQDPDRQQADQPSPFFQFGLRQSQIEALRHGRPWEEMNRYAAMEEEAEGGTAVLQVAVRHEKPIKEYLFWKKIDRLVNPPPPLRVMSVTEGMLVYFKVAFACALVLGSPWIFWQLWAFVAEGLYPHEKRPFYLFLPLSLGLFLAGVFLCQFLVMPKAVAMFLNFNDWLDLETELRLSEWLGFAVMMPLLFGLSFQTPLVMVFLNRLGVFDVEYFRRQRRMAWFLLGVFAAFITPTPNPFNMLALWLPLIVLFELGVILCDFPRLPILLSSEKKSP